MGSRSTSAHFIPTISTTFLLSPLQPPRSDCIDLKCRIDLVIQLIGVKRLWYVIVHADRQATFPVSLQGVCSHSYDGLE